MANVNKVADALLKFFKIEDADRDQRYTERETSKMDKGLCAFLDNYDNTIGNGFTYADVMKFLNEVTVDGMSQFYRYFKFRYDEKCGDIWASFNKADIFPLNSGDISPDDATVQAILKESGLPSDLFSHDPADGFTNKAEITHASLVSGAPTLLILEDLHENASSWWFNAQTIQRLLEANESLIVFDEVMNGPVVYDMKEAENAWKLLKKYIINYNDDDTQKAIFFKDKLYGANWKLKLPLMKGLLKGLFGDEIGSIDIQKLKEKLESNIALRLILISLDAHLALKITFGDRILMVNSESRIPTDSRTINEAGSLKVEGWDDFEKMAVILTALATFPKVGEDRNSCEKPVPLSPYEISAAVAGAQTFADSVNTRTDTWIANIMALAYDPRNSYELPLPLDRDPPVLVLIGGATHIPRLVQKLKGQFSIISARSDKSGERLQEDLR